MNNFKSGVILKDRILLAPIANDDHSYLLQKLGIENTDGNSTRDFVKVRLVPPFGDKMADIDDWEYIVDQDNTPSWYNRNSHDCKSKFTQAVKEFVEEHYIKICGHVWTPIKTDSKGTYYLLDDVLGNRRYKFGITNNYAESNVRDVIKKRSLAKELKKEFGDRIVLTTTDLLSLDGVDEYGVVEGDILSIPTLDLYRECRKRIPLLEMAGNWWLATPDSIRKYSKNISYVNVVMNDGAVGYVDSTYHLAIRPYFILKPE